MPEVFGCSQCGWFGESEELTVIDEQANFSGEEDFDAGSAVGFCPACQGQVNELS